MDGGYRSGDRRVINRSGGTEPAPRQQEQPQPVVDEPRVSHRVPASYREEPGNKKSPKRLILWIVAAVVIILLAIGGWVAWSASHSQNGSTAINSNEYQAVFFTNGQVYFGKLQAFNNDYLKLTDIFYLQTQSSDSSTTGSENPQKTSTDSSNVQLIKLGDEIHGPEDEMILSKQQVLFYENLKSDGKVAQSIDKYKQANK